MYEPKLFGVEPDKQTSPHGATYVWDRGSVDVEIDKVFNAGWWEIDVCFDGVEDDYVNHKEPTLEKAVEYAEGKIREHHKILSLMIDGGRDGN